MIPKKIHYCWFGRGEKPELAKKCIASCPLIWGNIPEDDETLRSILHIPPHHKIIALVASGYYPSTPYKVAVSTKRDTNTILHIIE